MMVSGLFAVDLGLRRSVEYISGNSRLTFCLLALSRRISLYKSNVEPTASNSLWEPRV